MAASPASSLQKVANTSHVVITSNQASHGCHHHNETSSAVDHDSSTIVERILRFSGQVALLMIATFALSSLCFLPVFLGGLRYFQGTVKLSTCLKACPNEMDQCIHPTIPWSVKLCANQYSVGSVAIGAIYLITGCCGAAYFTMRTFPLHYRTHRAKRSLFLNTLTVTLIGVTIHLLDGIIGTYNLNAGVGAFTFLSAYLLYNLPKATGSVGDEKTASLAPAFNLKITSRIFQNSNLRGREKTSSAVSSTNTRTFTSGGNATPQQEVLQPSNLSKLIAFGLHAVPPLLLGVVLLEKSLRSILRYSHPELIVAVGYPLCFQTLTFVVKRATSAMVWSGGGHGAVRAEGILLKAYLLQHVVQLTTNLSLGKDQIITFATSTTTTCATLLLPILWKRSGPKRECIKRWFCGIFDIGRSTRATQGSSNSKTIGSGGIKRIHVMAFENTQGPQSTEAARSDQRSTAESSTSAFAESITNQSDSSEIVVRSTGLTAIQPLSAGQRQKAPTTDTSTTIDLWELIITISIASMTTSAGLAFSIVVTRELCLTWFFRSSKYNPSAPFWQSLGFNYELLESAVIVWGIIVIFAAMLEVINVKFLLAWRRNWSYLFRCIVVICIFHAPYIGAWMLAATIEVEGYWDEQRQTGAESGSATILA